MFLRFVFFRYFPSFFLFFSVVSLQTDTLVSKHTSSTFSLPQHNQNTCISFRSHGSFRFCILRDFFFEFRTFYALAALLCLRIFFRQTILAAIPLAHAPSSDYYTTRSYFPSPTIPSSGNLNHAVCFHFSLQLYVDSPVSP